MNHNWTKRLIVGLLLMLVGYGIVLIRVKHSRVMKSIESQIEMEKQIEEANRQQDAYIALIDTACQYLKDGMNYEKVGNYNDAELAFKKATALRPDWAEAHYRLGDLYTELGRYEEAIKEYETMNKWAETHYRLGLLYTKLGRYEEAMKEYETLKKSNSLPTAAGRLLDLINESKGK